MSIKSFTNVSKSSKFSFLKFSLITKKATKAKMTVTKAKMTKIFLLFAELSFIMVFSDTLIPPSFFNLAFELPLRLNELKSPVQYIKIMSLFYFVNISAN